MTRGQRKRSTWWMPSALLALGVTVAMGLSAGVATAQMFHPNYGPNPPGWLSSLHISGHVQNSTGVFIDSNAIEYNSLNSGALAGKGYGHGAKNSLSTERNFIQVDVNDNPTENSQLFLRAWGVYEPSYPFEISCNNRTEPCNSDFYNEYGIREFWVKQRFGPLQLFVGRQLVVWGESVAFRATDIINPQDLSWGFGFAQLEQSRLPIWLIHPILNLPDWGPFAANFLEVAYSPGFDFLYNHVDTAGNSNGNDGQNAVAGRNTIIIVPTGGRFTGRGDTRTIITPGLPDACGGGVVAGTVWPLVRCEGPGNPYAPAGSPDGGAGFFVPNASKKYPRATWGNSYVFVRLHTLVKDYELAAVFGWAHEQGTSFYLSQQSIPISAPFADGSRMYLQDVFERDPQYLGFGMSGNKPLYLPGPLATLPFVARFEAFYKNHQTFNAYNEPGTIFTAAGGPGNYTFQNGFGALDGQLHSDTVKWILGLDLDSAYVPWLTTTGTLTANFEVDGTTILSYNKNMQQVIGVGFTRAYHNDVGGSINLLTSWWWSAIAPNWTMVYNPNGNTWLLFPGLQLNPPWTNKYFVSFKWIEIMGTNAIGPDAGFFKGLSQLVAVFQYNFNVL